MSRRGEKRRSRVARTRDRRSRVQRGARSPLEDGRGGDDFVVRGVAPASVEINRGRRLREGLTEEDVIDLNRVETVNAVSRSAVAPIAERVRPHVVTLVE